jgi:hypothetical protein
MGFITIGELNIKHSLPFILTLCNLAMEAASRYYPDNKAKDGTTISNTILDTYIYSFGFLSSVFIPCILKINKNEIRENPVQKRKCLHYTVFIIIFVIHMFSKAVPPILRGAYTEQSAKAANSLAEGPFVYIGIEMIFLPIATRCLLKYKYFIHHYLAIIVFVLLGNASDLILGYYSLMLKDKIPATIMEMVNTLIDVIFYTSEKYMLEVLYYPYWNINIALGSCLFVYTSGMLIFALANSNSEMKLVKDFYLYFSDINPGIIVGKIVLTLIAKIGFCTFSILTLYYFNPNFVLINFHISQFILILIDKSQSTNKYYCIILFVLQFFFLLVYLEIIELNFCGLNKNVKKSVDKRGVDELLGDNGRDSILGINENIDINKDYYIDSLENVENNNKVYEMSPRN